MNTTPGRVDRDDLLARVSLADVLDAVSGPAEGRRWHCPDPEHSDVHPSVTMHADGTGEQRWRCWSGGHGGTAVDAVMVAQRVEFTTALEWLAERHGHLPVLQQLAAPLAEPGRPDPAVDVYVTRAARLLWTPAGRPQRDWLAGRGLDEPVLRINRVGADPGRRFLPRPAGMPAGWPAVVFPAVDRDGTIAYFQARYLDPPAGRAKFDNPAARLAANPRLAWMTPPEPNRSGQLWVCEGAGDALVAAQAGFNAVGVLGAGYPDRRIATTIAAAIHDDPALEQVIVCFDADAAGQAGTAQLVSLLATTTVVTVTPPAGCDLTDWAAADPDWHTALGAVATTPPSALAEMPELGLSIVGVAG